MHQWIPLDDDHMPPNGEWAWYWCKEASLIHDVMGHPGQGPGEEYHYEAGPVLGKADYSDFDAGGWQVVDLNGNYIGEFTHWMPLEYPQAPSRTIEEQT